MNVKIKYIRNPGDLNKERLVLKVLRDDDIGYYLVLDTTSNDDGSISNLVRHPYWFPDKKVKSGDMVVLYTKNGKESKKANKNGSTSHFFYRGMDKTVWNKNDDCAVIIHISNWDVKGYE